MAELFADATYLSRADLDLSATADIERSIADYRPDLIINAAAYTAVDKAETDRTQAELVNAAGPTAIGEAAHAIGAHVIHFSTDYVFDGRASIAYKPTDPTNPQSIYGSSKLAGETGLRDSGCSHWIIRTSWVFGSHGNNFLKTMLRLAQQPGDLNVVEDQHGSPTYAKDLARLCYDLTHQNTRVGALPNGTYHYSCDECLSWFEFAVLIFRRATAAGIIPAEPSVNGVSTENYATVAPRPAFSALATSPELKERMTFDSDLMLAIDETLKTVTTEHQATR